LADVLSFGLAPALMALSLNGVFEENPELNAFTVWKFLPLLMAAFSALRLAKFNIDERQSTVFFGLPTPSNALFWVGMALAGVGGILNFDGLNELILAFTGSPTAIGIGAIILSLLLISDVPLMSLKFESYGWSGNQARYLLLLLGIGLFVLFGFSSIPIILLLYFILSITIR
jgi:CDP-diacylglycerol--serine O-phosphatidyltransferase